MRDAWPIIEPATPLSWNWHFDAICRRLEEIAFTPNARSIINVPPGSGKSSIISVLWPTWVWTRTPETRFLFASHKEALALRDSVRRRNVVMSEWFQRHWPLKLAGDANLKSEFHNASTGYMVALGTGGSTGYRGDILVLDDPNNATEMESETQRESTLLWLDQQWSSRGNKDAREVVVQQRTHAQDVTGHLLVQGGWDHLKIPMRFTGRASCPEDPRKAAGELMWPSVHDEARVATLTRRLGPYGTSGQLQQDPSPQEGGILKAEWLANRWTRHRSGDFILGKRRVSVQSGMCYVIVDPAASVKQTADFTEILTFWWDGTDLVLVERTHERLEGPDINPRVKQHVEAWHADVAWYEPVAFQLALIQYGLREGVPAREIPREYVDRDKVSRAMAATPLLASGHFWLPEGAPWLSEYIHELLIFPNGEHDDEVDGTSYGVAVATMITPAQLPKREKPEDDRDVPSDPLSDVYGNSAPRY